MITASTSRNAAPANMPTPMPPALTLTFSSDFASSISFWTSVEMSFVASWTSRPMVGSWSFACCVMRILWSIVGLLVRPYRPGASEVAQPQVRHAQRHGHLGHDEPVLGEFPEPDRVSLPGGDPESDDVGRRPDRRRVAAEVGAERQRPPQHVALVPVSRGELADDRSQRGDVRDVVDDRG